MRYPLGKWERFGSQVTGLAAEVGQMQKEPLGLGRWGLLPGRSPLRLRWWCPDQASSFPRGVLASLCVIRTPPLSLSEKGLIQGIGEAAWSLSRAAGMGTEQFKAEREPHKTSSCANAPWRGCRPEECVLPPQLTSPPYPLNASKALPSHGCENR